MTEDWRFSYDRPLLAGFWAAARKALESHGKPATFPVDLADSDTRREVATLLGVDAARIGRTKRVALSELDAMLRAERFGLSLTDVLQQLHGKPVTPGESAVLVAGRRRDSIVETLTGALAGHGLDDAGWARRWIDEIRRHGKVNTETLPTLARRAAAILRRIHLPGAAGDWIARGDLAAQLGGGAHALDPGTPLSQLVLRAAAIAHDLPMPQRTTEARALWERCRVTLDSVSATVLTYALPCTGIDPWSTALRARTACRLPTHLTLRDLTAAPEQLVPAGTLVSACENPRLIDAAIDAEIKSPLVCMSGYLSTPARTLLTRLSASGADIRYHGDFDPDGLTITHQVLSLTNGRAWRMSAEDYQRGLAHAANEGIELTPLSSRIPPTPWDPALADTMTTVGHALEEEVILQDLLADLARPLNCC